jgi:hypothetical protein
MGGFNVSEIVFYYGVKGLLVGNREPRYAEITFAYDDDFFKFADLLAEAIGKFIGEVTDGGI